jgi:hypothetical protein
LARPKVPQKELHEWRESHFVELENTLQVFKSIRDDPEASDKDRLEAGKNIARLLSAMTPSRAGVVKPPAKAEHKPTEEEWEEIEKRLAS